MTPIGHYPIRTASARLTVVHDERGRRTTVELFNDIGGLIKIYHGTRAISVAENLKCPVVRTDKHK